MTPRRYPLPFVMLLLAMVWPTVSYAESTGGAAKPAAVVAAVRPAAALAAVPKATAPAAPHAAAVAAPAHGAALVPAAAESAPKTREIRLGRLYFKSTSETAADGTTKSSRSWGLAAKADGTGHAFDRSTQKELGANGSEQKKVVTTFGKLDAKGNATQRTWIKDSAKDASGSYSDATRVTVKTTVNDDGSKNIAEKLKSDTRLVGADGAMAKEIVLRNSTTDGKTGVVTTNESRKTNEATAPIAPAVRAPSAREADAAQLGTVGVTKFVDANGTLRFRDAASGRFVAAADVDRRLAPTDAK